MQAHSNLKARILSLVLSAAMVTSTMSAAVYAAEDTTDDTGAVGVIQSFAKLESRFIPSIGENAPDYVYGLAVELNTPAEDLHLPENLTAMVEQTTTTPAADAPATLPELPAAAAIPDTAEAADADAAADDTVSSDLPPSGTTDDGAKSVPDADTALTPEPDPEQEPDPETDAEATETAVEQETIPVTWASDKAYQPEASGTFIFTAALPESYILAEGVELPQIHVLVGKQARANAAPAITATATVGSTSKTISGDSLQAAITAGGGDPRSITKLEITAGKVTTADWGYFLNLTSLTTFEVRKDVSVEDPPSHVTIFSKQIVTTTVPYLKNLPPHTFTVANLATVNFPDVETIDSGALTGATLKNASFPKLKSIGPAAFGDCGFFKTLRLPATPPTVGDNAFRNCPELRALRFVNADGTALRGEALTAAQDAYKADSADGDVMDNKWHGWTIAAPAITATVTFPPGYPPQEISGATLEKALENFDLYVVHKLEITAGEVTNADWLYLKNLKNLTTFEINEEVEVEDIPGGAAIIFPKSIVSVTVPQAIAIGYNAFKSCDALTTANLPAATQIGATAFGGCTSLTTANLPAATQIGATAFGGCTSLTSASFPAVGFISPNAFKDCTALVTLKLPATPPIVQINAFLNNPDTRALGYVDASGADLTGAALTAAQNNYRNDKASGAVVDNKWYGWTIGKTSTPSGGGSSGGGSSGGGTTVQSPTTPYAPSSNNTINSAVSSKSTTNVVSTAIKDAIAAGGTNATARATFNNFDFLAPEGLKTINEIVAKEAAGKSVNFKVNFDTVAQGAVVSRVSVDPAELAKVMTASLPLDVYYNQQKDNLVTNVSNMFDKFFTNKTVNISYKQKAPLAVNAELATKLDLSGLNQKTLHVYSYNRETNSYTLFDKSNCWVDDNGYFHLTAPFGGSIIITDAPLTKR